MIAKEKRSWEKRYETLQGEFNTFKSEIESERTKQEEKLKTQVDEMKKGMPPQILKLLEKLSIQEQYEFLNEPENKIEKKLASLEIGESSNWNDSTTWKIDGKTFKI